MQIKIDIQTSTNKKEPIDTTVTFPFTETQKLEIAKLRKEFKDKVIDFDINLTIRQCVEQILAQHSKLTKKAV